MSSIRVPRHATVALAVFFLGCPADEVGPPPGPPPEPKANADANSSYMIAQENARASLIDWNATQDFNKMQAARAVADLDGDGVVDAVVAPGIALEQNAS